MADEEVTLIRLVRDSILSITRQIERGNVSEDMADHLAFRLEQLYGHVLRLSAFHPNLSEIEPFIREAARLLRAFEDSSHNDSYELPMQCDGRVERPRFGISREQLQYLLQNGFTGPQIAEMLSVSLSTVRRRMREFNVSVKDLYSNITEGELDNVIREILRDFPNCGYRRALGELKRRG